MAGIVIGPRRPFGKAVKGLLRVDPKEPLAEKLAKKKHRPKK
jgi:hypothetical protein